MIPPSNSPCPLTGHGVNQWINKKVIFLLCNGVSPEEIWKIVQWETRGCGRETLQDVQHSLETASRVMRADTHQSAPPGAFFEHSPRAWVNPGRRAYTGRPKKSPAFDTLLRSKVLWKYRETVVDSWRERSRQIEPKQALLELFDGEDRLICVAAEKHQHVTAPLREVLRVPPKEWSFIVPTPMVTTWGITQAGRPSMRTNSNVARRWSLVLEFDSGTLNEQASLIAYLSLYRRLRMIVFSGGKSLHSWWDVYQHNEGKSRQFFEKACRLGADPATWTPSQLVRIPGGTNSKTGQAQEIVYFGP